MCVRLINLTAQTITTIAQIRSTGDPLQSWIWLDVDSRGSIGPVDGVVATKSLCDGAACAYKFPITGDTNVPPATFPKERVQARKAPSPILDMRVASRILTAITRGRSPSAPPKAESFSWGMERLEFSRSTFRSHQIPHGPFQQRITPADKISGETAQSLASPGVLVLDSPRCTDMRYLVVSETSRMQTI